MIIQISETALRQIARLVLRETILRENQYDDDFNRTYTDFINFDKEKARQYGDDNWFDERYMRENHPEITVAPADIATRADLRQKHDAVSVLWNKTDNEEREEQTRQSQALLNKQSRLIKLAIEDFGTTGNLAEAGYILPDGRLLKFGQGGDRTEDHRAIEGIYKRNEIPIWSDEYRYNYVVDFLNHGAIRIDANTGLIDMTREPTDKQYTMLRRLVQGTGGEAYVDFTDQTGNTIHSVAYEAARPQRVTMDIYRFFNENIFPEGC